MRETKMKKVLVVMLALAMVFAMNITTFAATEMSEPKLTYGTLQADGTWAITISVDGSVDAFDYGIAYDNTKASVSSIKFNSDFSDFYAGGGVNPGSNDQGITGRADNKTYVVVGGTIAREDGSSVTYTGELATITFKVTDASAQFVLLKNSGKVAETLKASGKTLDVTEALANGGTPITIPVATAAPTDTPATDVPATDVPATDVPATDAPTSDAPTTTAPVGTTNAPSTAKAATTTAPVATTATTATSTTSTSAKTGDTANVVLPIIAICAAAAAVVVASKKKIEE